MDRSGQSAEARRNWERSSRKAKPACAKASAGEGGKRGIRTLGTVARTTVFETVPFDRSGIFPFQIKNKYILLHLIEYPVLIFN